MAHEMNTLSICQERLSNALEKNKVVMGNRSGRMLQERKEGREEGKEKMERLVA